MITTMAAYPAALQDLPPLGQTGLTDASMNDNNNNNNASPPTVVASSGLCYTGLGYSPKRANDCYPYIRRPEEATDFYMIRNF